METLIAILLYMQLVHSGGTYYQSEIDHIEDQHTLQIQEIENNPAEMNRITTIYLPQVDDVIVITVPDDAR